MRSLFPFIFLLVPISEIAVFILVGSQIGVLPTILLVILTAIAGATLLRIQGFGVLSRIRAETEAGRLPGRELVHGVMIMVAGVCLLVPGFITDTIGITLFIPAVRERVFGFLKNKVQVFTPAGQPGAAAGRRPGAAPARPVIELGEEEFSRRPDPSSPWRDEDDRGR